MLATLRKREPVASEADLSYPDEAHALLQQLIEHTLMTGAFGGEGHKAPGDDAEYLLDIEWNGVRCILVREQTPSSSRSQGFLSPREQEIARMIALGYPNKVIAAVLDISSWTVNTHLRRIFAKLSVSSRAAMVAKLLEEGLMEKKTACVRVRTPHSDSEE